MEKTILRYLANPAILTDDGVILAVERDADGAVKALIVDKTPFYPQGGGQASDIGQIIGSNGVFNVQSVRLRDGFAVHEGVFAQGGLCVGEQIRLDVDATVRRHHTRLHSAGELICAAVRSLCATWQVNSANHFPNAARIVFDGWLSPEKIDDFKGMLGDRLMALADDAGEIQVVVTDSLEEVASLCRFTPSYLKPGEQYRVVIMPDGIGRPCMGTHVSHVADIGDIVLGNVRSKKGAVSVSYAVAA